MQTLLMVLANMGSILEGEKSLPFWCTCLFLIKFNHSSGWIITRIIMTSYCVELCCQWINDPHWAVYTVDTWIFCAQHSANLHLLMPLLLNMFKLCLQSLVTERNCLMTQAANHAQNVLSTMTWLNVMYYTAAACVNSSMHAIHVTCKMMYMYLTWIIKIC